ncbi:MAG TPA: Ni/Fe hydrogenase subunit alpha [Acidimicrobiia bacterium]|nr:Ni/Fe hydrogenase subunit alpha [Acidimicrobiia bacterium]
MVVRTRDGKVTQVQLRIYEPPRFFEAFLRGRKYTEPPDITARICGICPVAYQMSACQAIEDACGVTVEGPIRELRHLLYCGEWIESHALHVYLLHAPDFLGYESAIEMARDHKQIVEQGLQLKKVGNDVLNLIGGRAIHPINVRVGGFYRVPTRSELEPLADRLEWARQAALDTVALVGGFDFPDFEQDYEFVALRHPTEYPFLGGRIVSDRGLDIAVGDFYQFFEEEQVAHSNALHARIRGRGAYLTGPLARYNLNFEQLTPLARQAAAGVGFGPVVRNPFKSIVVRAVEIVHACDQALRIIASYRPPDRPFVDVEPRAGTGHACTEAPRGILYHRYRIDDQGDITDARIVPPTSQNQAQIEADLADFVTDRLELDQHALTHQCEQAIRSYDPCISCATHFLDLKVVPE